jgi:hypothetical protein
VTAQEPLETTNLDRYGSEILPWSRPRDLLKIGLLSSGVTSFLGTVGQDARPHAAGIGAAWHDGDLYFTSGPGTRKARNLAANPACTISVRLDGIDVVFEGDARRITDKAVLEAVVALYNNVGWPAEVDGDAFTAPYSAPAAGPPPWHLYRFEIQTAFGTATAEPYGATRWRFRP